MNGWLESIAGPEYAAALMWTIVALIVLLVLLLSIRIVRGFSTGTFIAGGRNRKTRLAVMDATAVDSHRRLILVRRDDVEHLLLIGGPTDVVVEQNIRLVAPARRQTEELGHHYAQGNFVDAPATVEPHRAQPQPEQPQRHASAQRHEPVAAPPAQRPTVTPAASIAPSSSRAEPRFSQHAAPTPAARPVVAPVTPAPVSSAPVTPVQPVRPAVAPVQAGSHTISAPTVPATKTARPDLDDELLKELEVSLDKDQAAAPAQQPVLKSAVDTTLDDEMSKLLSDLAGKR